MRVFEKRVLRRIFGPQRDEVTGEWRLHNEELYDLYCSPNIIMEGGGGGGGINSKRRKGAVLVKCKGGRRGG
jgi:hypothetical protein